MSDTFVLYAGMVCFGMIVLGLALTILQCRRSEGEIAARSAQQSMPSQPAQSAPAASSRVAHDAGRIQ